MEIHSTTDVSTHPFRSVLHDANEFSRITVSDFFQYRWIAGTQKVRAEKYQFLQS
jgi:hypothetical protein